MSRAHRRRSALGGAGPPLANIALAALAEKTKGSRAIAVTDTNVNATQGGNDSANPKDKSRLWKQAAELHMIPNTTDGGANRTVGERPQGFHVAAALHASHGLTIQKLRKALDDQSTVTNQVRELVCSLRSCSTVFSITDSIKKCHLDLNSLSICFGALRFVR